MAKISLTQCHDGQLRFLLEATHRVYLEEPAAVNKLLLNFMAVHPAATL